MQRFPSRLKVQNSFGGMKTDNLELKPLQPKDAAQLFLYRDSAEGANDLCGFVTLVARRSRTFCSLMTHNVSSYLSSKIIIHNSSRVLHAQVFIGTSTGRCQYCMLPSGQVMPSAKERDLEWSNNCFQNHGDCESGRWLMQDLWRKKDEWMKKATEWYGDNIYSKVQLLTGYPSWVSTVSLQQNHDHAPCRKTSPEKGPYSVPVPISRWILNRFPFPISDVLLCSFGHRWQTDPCSTPEMFPSPWNGKSVRRHHASPCAVQWLKGSKGWAARCWMPLRQCPCYRSSAKETNLLGIALEIF